MTSPERIVLPRSGLVLVRHESVDQWELPLDRRHSLARCGVTYGVSLPGIDLFAYSSLLGAMTEMDTRILALRSALLAGTEETIARTCFEWDRGATWEERTNSDVENYMDQARAVLAALCGEESK